MSERDGFQPGVPSWVDVFGPDPEQLKAFYGAVFGWDFTGPGEMLGDPPGEYFVAQLRGRDVAVGASLPPQAGGPRWNTYVEVEKVDGSAEAIEGAGGTGARPALRRAPRRPDRRRGRPPRRVVRDLGARERRGAQLVNEPSAWSMSALTTPTATPPPRSTVPSSAGSSTRSSSATFDVGLFPLPGYVGGEPEQPVPRDLVATILPGQNGDANWSVDFWVDDVDRAAATAGDRGGNVITEPYSVPPLRQAVVADPNGVPFSVSKVTVG